MNDLFSDSPQEGDLVVSKRFSEEYYSDRVGVQFKYVRKRQAKPVHVMTYMDGKTLHYDDEVKMVIAE